MKSHKYLLVDESILPKYYLDVIKARKMIESENKSITEVCKICNISRSTYYKYYDLVFEVPVTFQKKVIIGFKVDDIKGVLSNIINEISKVNGNVLTINQDMPLRHIANIVVMIEISNLSITLEELLINLKSLNYVRNVEVCGYE